MLTISFKDQKEIFGKIVYLWLKDFLNQYFKITIYMYVPDGTQFNGKLSIKSFSRIKKV